PDYLQSPTKNDHCPLPLILRTWRRSAVHRSTCIAGSIVMKLPRRKFLHLAAGAAALPAVSRIARAQSYPTRPVRAVVAFAPGGVTDTFARVMAQRLTEQLGKQVYVENIAGASASSSGSRWASISSMFPSGAAGPRLPQSSPVTHRSASARHRRPCNTSRKEPCARSRSLARRSQIFPDVPTMTEVGYPQIEGDSWVGILVPAGTPAEIIAVLYRESAKILEQP